ncbi:hypothetical protein EMCRGX_G016457 [Ephydatia muelleri]
MVKQDVFIYQIPPRASNRAVRAADWDLPNPQWKGRLKVVAKGDKCFIKLEDKITGELFAQCPVDAFPGLAVEPVSDSSRYFVLRLEDSTGRHAFVGLGFEDRGDSFDFNVALQDHFKWVKQEKKLAEETHTHAAAPPKDYSLKEGQKITINIAKTANVGAGATTAAKPRPSTGPSTGGIVIPLPPPSSTAHVPPPQATHAAVKQDKDDWGDFMSGPSNSGVPSSSGNKWVQF